MNAMNRKVDNDVNEYEKLVSNIMPQGNSAQAVKDLIRLLLLCDRNNLEYLRNNFVKGRVR